jgi:hypothetical protein
MTPATREAFLSLSVELTGFDEFELVRTGAVDVYYRWLAGAFADVLPELLSAWQAAASGPDREAALRREILGDPKLGPFARGVLVLWYTAAWNQLPPDWSTAYGTHPEDVNKAFGETYAEGLVWKTANLHPLGAKPPGFGTWAFPPEVDRGR